ncbi:hypothetical protein BU24DRAFT_467075 [Aaosphaeria arxii CBS 175.79]|uniref:Uncharacterized protein n=1 Tax=Aaosphaeria arxii CBS 175.79 TaxID=1450172 RepID=A0A6A5XC00_9PLEO|nr:uncharacterized protein BU24DRAFT_467075 [Aaosphaeria arxii CBS 175.79]KAF2010433.1 hypothetical protein BU24DRAFT_467075 [Aaosphaeria arxii CBS 175.79]
MTTDHSRLATCQNQPNKLVDQYQGIQKILDESIPSQERHGMFEAYQVRVGLRVGAWESNGKPRCPECLKVHCMPCLERADLHVLLDVHREGLKLRRDAWERGQQLETGMSPSPNRNVLDEAWVGDLLLGLLESENAENSKNIQAKSHPAQVLNEFMWNRTNLRDPPAAEARPPNQTLQELYGLYIPNGRKITVKLPQVQHGQSNKLMDPKDRPTAEPLPPTESMQVKEDFDFSNDGSDIIVRLPKDPIGDFRKLMQRYNGNADAERLLHSVMWRTLRESVAKFDKKQEEDRQDAEAVQTHAGLDIAQNSATESSGLPKRPREVPETRKESAEEDPVGRQTKKLKQGPEATLRRPMGPILAPNLSRG